MLVLLKKTGNVYRIFVGEFLEIDHLEGCDGLFVSAILHRSVRGQTDRQTDRHTIR
jgi:hypothetical protein